MAEILVVEDESKIQYIIEEYMKKSNHTVHSAYDGIDALSILKNSSIQLVILDLMIPNLDGFSVCKLIRSMSDIPIIILSARSDEDDKLKGYELGADDYMTKPFNPNVLVAKTNALLNRYHHSLHHDTLRFGTLLLSPTSHEVFSDGEKIELTYKEFELLNLFMNYPNCVFSREQLMDKVWGYDYVGSSRTVDTHVKNLRQKLGKNSEYIVTLIRSGYKFVV